MHAAEVVELAERLPELVLKDYSDWTSITFRGRGFAWVNHVANTAMIKSTHAEREAMLGSDPETFSAGWASSTTAWVSVALDHADADEVFEILAEGWRMTATKKAVMAFDEAMGFRRYEVTARALSGCGPGPRSQDSWVTEQGLPARPIRQLWEAPVVYRAYECWARRARTIGRGGGDRWRHG